MTEKKDAFLPRIIPNLKRFDEQTGKYAVSYSKAYAPAGHDFIKSFKVIREAYFYKHRLISYDAVCFYDHLHFLADNDFTFTLDQLAEQVGKGKHTIRKWIDELENAELVETVKIAVQKGGAQNLYLIRTPYFEADSLKGNTDTQRRRKKRILDEGGTLPETFLEEHIDRLRKQIEKNHAAHRRSEQTKETRAEQKRNWAVLFHEIGTSAAITFDSIVWRAYRHLSTRVDNTSDVAKWTGLDEIVRRQCKEKGILFSPYLLTLAREIFVFYERWNTPATTADTGDKNLSPDVASAAAPTDERAELRERERETLEKVLTSADNRKALKLNSFEQILNFLKRKLSDGLLTLTDLEQIAAPTFEPDVWQKLTTELRQ
jgi:predicted transcriptional regulator